MQNNLTINQNNSRSNKPFNIKHYFSDKEIFHLLFLTFAALKNDYYGKKFKLTIQVEDSKPWTFNGVTTYTDKRLVITQIFKKVLKTLYKRNNDTSFREFKELAPIKNKIKRIEEAMNNKKKVKM